jgi:tetratricopeptide (TPR) repeat protein
MPPDPEKPVFTNDAFISYSRKDREFSAKLEKALEDYKPPKGLNVPQRNLVVFRDEADFTGVEYEESIEKHLKNSKKMIVICSPNARKSQYVNDEIRRFAEIRGADHIIPVLLLGIPNNEAKPGQEEEMAFPEALCEVQKMPLATDYRGFNSQKDKVNKGRFESQWYMILANLYDLKRAEVEQREKKKQVRRRNITIGIVSVVILVLLGLLVWALISRSEAIRQRRISLARQLAVQSQSTSENYPQRSLLLAVEAVATITREGAPRVPVAEEALWQTLAKIGGRGLNGHEAAITAVAISSNNRWLVTDSRDGTARLWDLAAKDPAAAPIVLRGHESAIDAIAISPDNHWVVARGSLLSNKPARLWNLSTKDLAASPHAIVLRGHEGPITSIAIGSNSRWLVTGSEDGTARLWDLTAKNPEAAPIVLRGHKSGIAAVAFSSNNRWLVTGSRDTTVRLWKLKLDELVELGCRTAGRNMTEEEWEQYMGGLPYQKICSEITIHPSVIEAARDTARSGEIKTALAQFKRILQIEPNLVLKPEEEVKRVYALAVFDEGINLAERWEIKEAIANYEKAQRIDPTLNIDFESWKFLCWGGALSGFAQDVMGACERAVKLAPSKWKEKVRNSRGLARALTGNYTGAIEDFKAYIEWSKTNHMYEKFGQKREEWIKALEAGKNPFDDETLRTLQNE